jgi:hypothetical protein
MEDVSASCLLDELRQSQWQSPGTFQTACERVLVVGHCGHLLILSLNRIRPLVPAVDAER